MQSDLSYSHLCTALAEARIDLWKAHPFLLPSLFESLRDFLLDPLLTVACVLLPPLLSGAPRLDKIAASCLRAVSFVLIRTVYCRSHPHHDGDADSSRSASQRAILDTAAAVRAKMPKYKPPSDLYSTFLGVISFAVGAVGDVIGAMTSPKKMKKWVDNLAQLRSYLDATGIDDELDEVCQPAL